MIPLTVTAELSTPPVLDRPLYLDAILFAATGEALGQAHPSGWAALEDVLAAPLPLARVETPHGWWWAASHVVPAGPEQVSHLNRVPMVEEAARWTSRRTLNHGTGPDKRLRTPYFYRPGMLRLEWTCVGDKLQICGLLGRISGVGRLRGHGHGWVRRWRVEDGGPPAESYGSDLSLRHLPVELGPELSSLVVRRQLPLRPPYHRRLGSVSCWQLGAL